MKLRDRRSFEKPEVMIIPMIDIMFFLLVFFMISMLSMVDLKTVDVNMPKAANVQTNLNASFLVTIKPDKTLWLEDKQVPEETLVKLAKAKSLQDPKFAVIIRADQGVNYGDLMGFLDKLKGEGITRFALAADGK